MLDKELEKYQNIEVVYSEQNSVDKFVQWLVDGEWYDTGGNNWESKQDPDSAIKYCISELYLVFLKSLKDE